MTRSRFRRLSRTVAAALTVTLAAGCGSGSSGDTAGAPAVAQGGSVEDQLGFSRRGIAAAQAKVENSLAACMKRQGFDYVPVDAAAAQTALTGRPNLSDEEFERQFGHGVTTLYGKGSTQSDPNARQRDLLGASDRRAYDQILTGGKPEETFAKAVDTGDFSQLAGCTKQATDTLFGSSRLLTTLQRKLDELDESILADQRMVKTSEAWTACMRAATGTDYEDSDAVEVDLRGRLERIVGPPLPAGQVAPEGSYDKAALTALQRDELKLTEQDVGCERKHITPVETVVRKEKERAFRDTNADLLGRVRPLGS